MVCSKCNMQADENDVFCPNCGNKIEKRFIENVSNVTSNTITNTQNQEGENIMKNNGESTKVDSLYAKKLNKTAIYSCIFSIISWFIFWWLGPIGIGLGIRSLKEMKVNNEKGKILAIIGIILGAIGLSIYLYTKIKTM